ncbi:MAG: hypothetical protein Q8Q41_02255 [bacterium]|nr:hypothetical protein [bacterium]
MFKTTHKTFRDCLARLQWQRIHTSSESSIRLWQHQQLRKIVRHSYQSVPLYQELWRGLLESGQPVDLKKLPIINKETFRTRPSEEHLDNSRPLLSQWHATSGTSGEPFRVLMRDHLLQDSYAEFLKYRFLWWRGFSLQKIKSLKIARIRIRGHSDRNCLVLSVADFFKDTQSAVFALRDFAPEIIEGYPSMLIELCRYIQENNLRGILRPRFIVASGEMLNRAERTFVETILGGEAYDRYGLEELGVVGVECKFHVGFHPYSESYILEIVNENGEDVPVEHRGRIVITDLFNYSMPFIRYDTGDMGTLLDSPCRCGLQAPRLLLEGRYSAVLQFQKRKVHHLEFDGVLDSFQNAIMRYQVVKISENSIKVLIIPGESFSSSISRRIREGVCGLVGDTVRVTVEPSRAMVLTPAGKCRILVDMSEINSVSLR